MSKKYELCEEMKERMYEEGKISEEIKKWCEEYIENKAKEKKGGKPRTKNTEVGDVVEGKTAKEKKARKPRTKKTDVVQPAPIDEPEKIIAPIVTPEPVDENDDGVIDTREVEFHSHPGVTFLIDNDNNLYSMEEGNEFIGKFDAVNKKVELF